MTQTMTARKSPNQIIKLTLVLLLVAAVTAGVLGLTNYITKDRIAEQARIATEKAYSEVLPASGYNEIAFDNAAFPIIDKISAGAGGEGYVVELSFSGAQSTITAAVGIDAAGTVSGVSIIKHAETAGLGAKASEPGFREQYKGGAEHMSLTKSGGSIEGISGATITSDAVTAAVNTAMDAVAGLG